MPSLRYARLLVDEGNQFVEHAVAFIDSTDPDPLGVIAGALSAARPTRVSFVRRKEGVNAVFGGNGAIAPAQVAACASSILLESTMAHHQRDAEELLADSVRFDQGLFLGLARVRQVAQLFEVQLESD